MYMYNILHVLYFSTCTCTACMYSIRMLFYFLFSRAATNCDLFVLTRESLDASLTYYPHIGEQIREVAGNRANLVKKRSQAAAKAAAEGKSASDAAKAAAEVSCTVMIIVYVCTCISNM